MALISVSGDPGCRPEELARLAANKLGCALVTESSLAEMIAREFGADIAMPDRAWPHLATSIVARLALDQHVVMSTVGCELLFPRLPGVLRIKVSVPPPLAASDLRVEHLALRKRRFGRARTGGDCDLMISAATFTQEQMLSMVEAAVRSRELFESGTFSAGTEAEMQFQARLQLAKFGLATFGLKAQARGDVTKREFSHPTEEIFANVLDFYRIAWEYEPRSFPLQWDKDGKVLEAFTPDFYLPEFELFVELTTMKQALVTRKNRKIRLLRAIYPHVNVQVLYQKDLQDLIMKYGAAGKAGA